LQIFSAKTLKPLTNPISIGILEVVDIEVSRDEQFLFIAYGTGLVNMHYIGDNSFTFITTIQQGFANSVFQKLVVYHRSSSPQGEGSHAPSQAQDMFVCCLSSPEDIQICRLTNMQGLVSVHGKLDQSVAKQKCHQVVRSFNAGCTVYDILVHSSTKYLLALTEAGRILLFDIDIAQYKGYIEVQKGSLRLSMDPCSGIYLAVLSPAKPVEHINTVGCAHGAHLSLVKEYLQRQQSRIELFEFGTTRLLYSINTHMIVSKIFWSPDSRYITAGGHRFNGSLQLLNLDKNLYEKVLSVYDAVRHDVDFWNHVPIDLLKTNMEDQKRL
jgi:WD40 repeat protein